MDPEKRVSTHFKDQWLLLAEDRKPSEGCPVVFL